EDHAEVAEAIDDQPVVHDLVVAVHRRVEDAHHPGQSLDGHLHARTEAPGRGQEDPLDLHVLQARSTGPRILTACPCRASWPSRPDRRRSGPVWSPATRSCPSTATGPATSSSGSC